MRPAATGERVSQGVVASSLSVGAICEASIRLAGVLLGVRPLSQTTSACNYQCSDEQSFLELLVIEAQPQFNGKGSIFHLAPPEIIQVSVRKR